MICFAAVNSPFRLFFVVELTLVPVMLMNEIKALAHILLDGILVLHD